eukprot:scaffold82734_cov26-Tisochrysis_lutea.AAC.3
MARCTSRAAAAAAPPSSDAASCARASASARSRASASALRRASRTFSSPSSESEPSLDESTSDLEPPAAATSSRTLSALRTTSHAAVAVAMAWSAASLTAAAMSLKTSETRDMSEASCGAPTAAVRRDPDGGSFARERMREAASPALAAQSEAANVEQRPCLRASVIASINCRTARSARFPRPLRDPASSNAADASAGASSACLPTLDAAAAALRQARSTHCAHSQSTSQPPEPIAHTRLAILTDAAHARAASAAACARG